MKEDFHNEFKRSFNDAVIETLVAFANSKGGIVWIGIDDGGSMVPNFTIGSETLQKWMNEIKTKTSPALIPDLVEGKHHTIGLQIAEFPIKPVSFKGRYYKRVENANHLLTTHEISDLHFKTFNSSWDAHFSNEYTLQDISLDKVEKFIALSNIYKEHPITDSATEVLQKLELLKD